MPDACGLVRLLKPRPRTDHASLPPELWLEIFRFATYVPRVRGLSPGDPFDPQRPSNCAFGVNTPVSSLGTKRSLALVCRAWRALATVLLYEHVVISSRRRAYLLMQTLRSSDQQARSEQKGGSDGDVPRGHAQWIRHVEIHDCSRTSKTVAFWTAVAAILSLLPNLHVLSGIWERPLSQNLLDVFSRYLGHSIRGIYWEEGAIPEGQVSLLNATFLPKYQSLRVLDIRKLRLEEPDTFPATPPSSISLPSVVDVLIPTCPALLRFASNLDLPRLRRLVLDAASVRRSTPAIVLDSLTSLLAAHGPKISTLELLPMTSLSYKPSPISITTFLEPDVCPALDTLVFDCREKVITADSSPHHPPSKPNLSYGYSGSVPDSPTLSTPSPVLSSPHPTLRRIGIRGMGISRLYPNRPSHAQQHLESFLTHRALFPALETVRTVGFMVDASSNPFAKDIFIWWTERFEEYGLDLQDGEGVVWLYSDPVDSKAPVEEQIVSGDCATMLHKSDAGELAAKA